MEHWAKVGQYYERSTWKINLKIRDCLQILLLISGSESFLMISEGKKSYLSCLTLTKSKI